ADILLYVLNVLQFCLEERGVIPAKILLENERQRQEEWDGQIIKKRSSDSRKIDDFNSNEPAFRALSLFQTDSRERRRFFLLLVATVLLIVVNLYLYAF